MALSAAERKPQGMPPCRGLDAGIVYAMAMVNRVLHSPMCDWMFKCGCKTLWNGGWSDCNIHNMHGNPRCPWCMPAFDVRLRGWFFLWRLDSTPDQDGLAVLALSLPLLLWRRSSRGLAWLPVIAALCLAAFVCSELIVGAAYTIIYEYPFFVLWPQPGHSEYKAPADAVRLDSSGLGLLPSLLLGSLGGWVWALTIAVVLGALFLVGRCALRSLQVLVVPLDDGCSV
eukprot:TRINITY_DN31062_c0_g1_i1.p1 TRINITY_DN31062_c0_g1~~TRINITY_DN31062_c0_g1_i1.p1  ORF type:complete len:228 (-),score=20.23 TRINITY_DN31062_c0_g1_i1:51-734(-)